MKKTILLFLSLIWLVQGMYAQKDALIRGSVLDSLSHNPLTGATLILEDGRGVTTDASGNFEIGVPHGTHTLQVRYLGYHEHSFSAFLQPGDTLVLTILLSPQSKVLNEVVVSADKFEQRLADVTLSMVVLKPERITESNALTLDEVLNQLSGVEVLDGQPSIRGGSGYSYGAGSRVLVVVDGLPLMSGDAGDVKWNFLPLDNLKQVEVIKGASSVLYGSSALNGVINLQTRQPGNRPETSVRLFSGAYLRPARPELVWSHSPRWYAGASLNHAQKAGKFDIVGNLNVYNNTGYRQDEYEKHLRMNVNLRYHPGKITGMTSGVNLNGMLVHSSDFFLWQNADSGAYRQIPSGVVPLNGIRFTVDPYILYHTNKGGLHTLKTRVFINRNTMPENPDKNNRFTQMLGEYRYNMPISISTRLALGIAENYAKVYAALYGNHARNEMAVYAQLNSDIGGSVKGVFGVRWENYKLDETWTIANPVFRAGINYRLSSFSHIRMSVGQGYRFPSIAEKYTATQLGALNIFPNPDLVPEKGWSAEAGFLQGFSFGNWKGSFDIALYQNQYREMIEFAFGLYLPDSVTVPNLDYVGFKALNVGKARITGTEVLLNLTGDLGGLGVDLQGGYNYADPVDLTIPASDSVDNILKYRFRHSVKANMDLSLKKWSAGLTCVANSFMERVDSVFIDPVFGNAILPGYPAYREAHRKGYMVIDGRLSYRFTPNVQLSITVKNLMNKEYIGRPGDIYPPRNITIQFIMKL